jgi:hypothetical protein
MKLSKAIKNLEPETVAELEAMSREDLEQRIVQANQSMQQVEQELEAKEEYQELKEAVKAMEAGKKEVHKRQNSIITVCVSLLDTKSKDSE